MSIFLAPSNARIKNSRRTNVTMLSERAIAQGLFVIVHGLFVIPKDKHKHNCSKKLRNGAFLWAATLS
jgi:hypothetical protein